MEDIPSSSVIVDVKLVAKRGFCNSTKSIFISVLDVSQAYLEKNNCKFTSLYFFPLTSLHIFRGNTNFIFLNLNLIVPQVQGANKGSDP